MSSLVCCRPITHTFHAILHSHCVVVHIGRSVDEFYKAKTELLCDKMVIKCEERSITETHIVIDDLCAKRLVQCLGAFSKTPPTTPAPMAVYEVFTQPETLKYLDVMDLVPMLVRGHERSMEDLLVKESCVFPSAVILMTRPEDNVRAFAMSKMTTAKHKITLEEFSPMSPLVSTIVDTICLFLFFTNLIFLSLLFIFCVSSDKPWCLRAFWFSKRHGPCVANTLWCCHARGR